jgi:hypothetical protein
MPAIYATSESGIIESWDATYATARSGSNLGAEVDGQYMRAGQTLAGGFYFCWEGFIEFDLSSITPSSTIDSAVLALSPNSGDNDLEGFTWRVRDFDYGATLTTGDYVAGASLGATGTLRAHKAVAAGSWVPNDTYQDFDDDAMAALVTANIGGVIRLIVFTDRHQAGTTPTQDEYRYFGGVGDPNPPRLTVEWTPPAAGGGSTSSIANLGALRSLDSLRTR